MILSAEYADKKACPHCGSPARKLGSWEVRDGQFFFTPRPVIVREWFGEDRPTRSPEKWTEVERQRAHTDRDGVTTIKTEKRWSLVATHMCTAFLTGEECSGNELMVWSEPISYRGTEYEWMAAPERVAGTTEVVQAFAAKLST